MRKIKVCGMNNVENTLEISNLSPDYLGFIFYEKSKRYAGDLKRSKWVRDLQIMPKKIGVFVDCERDKLIEYVSELKLSGVQLHGDETPQYCEHIRKNLKDITIWKAFRISSDFNLSKLGVYFDKCDMFLFDSLVGGSGEVFDWGVLDEYKYNLPFGVAGGIGPANIKEVIYAFYNMPNFELIDINSKVEESPGVKSVLLTEQSIQNFRSCVK